MKLNDLKKIIKEENIKKIVEKNDKIERIKRNFLKELVKNLYPSSVLESCCQALHYDSALKLSHVKSV